MGRKIRIVQLMHPGSEASITANDKRRGFKSWNNSGHKRKFIMGAGKYIRSLEDKEQLEGGLMFWETWEAESYYKKIEDSKGRGDLPSYIHRPFYTNHTGKNLQSTDPYVYGNSFKYMSLGQRKRGKPTELQNLEKGSIILFGSKLKGQFHLDTVFVVKKIAGLVNKENYKIYKGQISETYYKCVIEKLFEGQEGDQALGKDEASDAQFTLYEGATIDDPYEGMFSFFPCKPYRKEESFTRMVLPSEDFYINERMSSGYSYKTIPHALNGKAYIKDINVLKNYWRKLAEEVLRRGLHIGIYNQEVKTPTIKKYLQ